MASLGNAINQRMDYLIRRQGVVSGNVANSETPGYLARDLDFNKAVKKATLQMDTSNASHLTSGSDRYRTAITQDKTHMRYDGNSVKVDEEMYKLNQIQLQYRLLTNLYQKHASFHKAALGKSGGQQ